MGARRREASERALTLAIAEVYRLEGLACPGRFNSAARTSRALQCVIKYINSARESRDQMSTWTNAAEGNCVAARRGGEQPEAERSA